MKGIGKFIMGGLILAIVAFFCWYFSDIIIYILIAVVISILGRPLMELLGYLRFKGIKLSEGLKAAITLIFIWTVFAMLFYSLIPLLVNEFSSLSKVDFTVVAVRLEAPLEYISSKLREFGMLDEGRDFKAYLAESIASVFQLNMLKSFSASLVNFISNLAVALFSITFITFFFLKEKKLFLRILLAIIPEKHSEGVRNTLNSVQPLLIRYFVGILIQTTCVAVLNTFGLWIIGLDFSHAVVIGIVTGILNLIPYIGPLIGAAFGLLIGLILHINDPMTILMSELIYMIIVFSITALIDNTVLQPLIYGNSVYAHPLEIFIVILIAGSLAGIPGMILAIPGYTVVRVILKEFFADRRIVKSLTRRLD